MPDENDREDPAKHRRRSTDCEQPKELLSPKDGGLWSVVRNSVGVAFVLTVCVGVGRFSGTVDTNVKDIDHNKVAIKEMLRQNQQLIIALKEQNVQQKESDKRFEEKFDDANEKLDDINNGVQQNRESIIIMQNGKLSMIDNTGVNVAMR